MKENFTYCDDATKIEELKSANIPRMRDKTMSILHIENGIICPYSQETKEFHGEILLEDGSIIPNVCSGNSYVNLDTNKKYNLPKEYDKKDSVIYLGSINLCWGHYITDGICKLWCTGNKSIQQLLDQNTPIVFVAEFMENILTIPSSWKHLIQLIFGRDVEILPLQINTKFKHIYVPTNSIQITDNGRIYTKEFVELRNILLNAALKLRKKWPIYERIYLSRTKLSSDHAEYGERPIEKVFKKIGFKILYPEKLSFEEQVWYLHNAKMVAGTMGSVSHNFLFCSANTKAIILRKAWYTNDFQYLINQVAELDVQYIDSHLSVFINEHANEGPFYLFINSNFQRFIYNYFSIKIEENFNARLFINYAKNCMKRSNFDKRNIAPHYYYEQMENKLSHNIGFFKRTYRKCLDYFSPNMRYFIKNVAKLITR